MNGIQIFEKYAQEYDDWFDVNRFTFESEILALKKFLPKGGKGLEVGAGTGRFAARLAIGVGVEPAKSMAEIARERGIEVHKAVAEKLPFDDFSFDFVLMASTICFVQDPVRALGEAKRVIKPGGHVLIGMIDRESFIGKMYESKKKKSKFYRYANFYSTEQVLEWIKKLAFRNIQTCQTIFKDPKEINTVEPVKRGHGDGGFAAILAQKETTI